METPWPQSNDRLRAWETCSVASTGHWWLVSLVEAPDRQAQNNVHAGMERHCRESLYVGSRILSLPSWTRNLSGIRTPISGSPGKELHWNDLWIHPRDKRPAVTFRSLAVKNPSSQSPEGLKRVEHRKNWNSPRRCTLSVGGVWCHSSFYNRVLEEARLPVAQRRPSGWGVERPQQGVVTFVPLWPLGMARIPTAILTQAILADRSCILTIPQKKEGFERPQAPVMRPTGGIAV